MSGVRNLLLTGAVAMAAGVGAAAPAKADGFFWDRLHNQQARIHEGVQKGSLTRGEAAKLEAQERQLRRLHGRLEDRGDGLSDRDRDRLRHALNQQSDRIHDQRTDDQFRRDRHDGRDSRDHERRYSSNERWWQRDRD
jgi:TolA-binding protein